LGEPGRFEAHMAELAHQHFERHAVLQGHGRQDAEGIHEAGDRAAFLRDLDEQLAGRAVVVEADVDVAFLAADIEVSAQRGGGPGGWMAGVPGAAFKAQSTTGKCASRSSGAPSIVSCSSMYSTIAWIAFDSYPSRLSARGTVWLTIFSMPPPTSFLYFTSAMS